MTLPNLSRRALFAGLAATGALAACGELPEAGAYIDEGGFGEPTAYNREILTGQRPVLISLGERFIAEVPTTVNFAFDSAHLDAEARGILQRQAAWIRQFPEVRFSVFGHTDLVGTPEYNRRLGLRRAQAVVHYLSRNGVSRSRLEALVSEGDTRPLIQTAARERMNRRTETQVSGFMQRHPTVMNGEYGQIIFREFVQSAGRRV